MENRTRSSDSLRVRLDLTDEQRTQVREALGRDGKAIELSVEPLEERVTPITAILISL